MVLKDQLAKFLPPSPPKLSKRNYRDEGDRLRDAVQFADAADAYDEHLAEHPDDFDIWVQRGNCLKDSSSHAAAKMAYERALKLRPEDGDVHLQLGHLLKLQGKKKEAAVEYKKALELNPDLVAAAGELRQLGLKTKASASLLETPAFSGVCANIFDISDLLVFLRVHSRVTGIQRVQSCIVHDMLSRNGSAVDHNLNNVLFCYCNQEEQAFYAVSADALMQLFEYLASPLVNRKGLDDALEVVEFSKVRIHPRKDDTYVILGAFWIGADYSSSLLLLKESGVRVGVYIYDLIPITHPQFVTPSTRQDVVNKFGDIMSLADFALTISKYVAKEVAYVLEAELGRSIPILPVPLAHVLPEPSADSDDIDENLIDSLPKEFVLCVCTLEGRKNHLLLLSIWQTLNRKYNGKIPSLVLVGKWGWRIEEFQDQLSAARNVDGKIMVLGNVSDQELKYLYERCLFTVFPSFVEGWGLPVGESLAQGKPCIASNTSSIPEVGGDFCRYINPYDPVGALEIIENTIIDRSGLKTWGDNVARDFKIRTWNDVAADFLLRLREAVAAIPANRPSAVVLDPGRIYPLTHDGIYGEGASWKSRAIKFVCAQGWRPFEDWGAWSSRRLARLAFATTAPEGANIRVLTHLRVPPPDERVTLALRSGETSKSVFFANDQAQWVSFEAVAGAGGRVEIVIERNGTIEQVDQNRPLFIGISAIAYHERNDVAARLDVLESMLGLTNNA